MAEAVSSADSVFRSVPATPVWTAFGLRIRSWLPLPELLPAPDDGAAHDVEIVCGVVPADLPEARLGGRWYQSAPGKMLLRVEGVARYLASEGRRVTIAPEAGSDLDEVRAFLLTVVFGALLHQRDDFVLHGSAIAVGGESVAFLGFSGAGKSTTAAAFRRRGHAVLTDDLCVVRPTAEGRSAIHPSFPHMKLWLDSLQELELSPAGLRRIRHKLEKRTLPLGAEFARAALPIRKLYVLRATDLAELSLVAAAGPEKFQILKNQTYRFGFLEGGEQQPRHFEQALRLAQEVPVVIARRPRESFRLDELVELIDADLRG